MSHKIILATALAAVTTVLSVMTVFSANAQRITDMGVSQQPDATMQWFHDSKFGLFIHWGIYAVYGEGEWYLYNKGLPYPEYIKAAYPQNGNYFDASAYNPDKWVQIAKNAGTKYMVLTTRHHDGFALFNSRFPNSITSQQTLGKDLVAEYVTACRKAGMRVGLYYSVLSWRYPGYFDAGGTDAQTNNFGIRTASWHKENATLMKAELYEQVKELMTQYGSIDDLWWDGGWMALKGTDRDGAGFWEPGLYRDQGNKWAGDYGIMGTDSAAAGRYLGIMGMVRKYQPYILSNPRSGWIGDYANEEGYAEIKGPIRKEYWEKCLSLNKDGWGYTKKQQVMSSGEVINVLINAVIRNGNLLLNVGPDQHGIIPEGQRQALAQIGSWMRKAGESIYSTTAGPWNPVDRQYGFTHRGNRLFVHILEDYKGDTFQVPAVDKKVIRCYDVYTRKMFHYSVNADHTITIRGIDRTSSKVDTVVGIEFDSAI